MQNCRASSTNPTPPHRWSGFLGARRCTRTHDTSTKLGHALTHAGSFAGTMSGKHLPISFQENSFEDDVHHGLYLRPLLLQLEEHEERHKKSDVTHSHYPPPCTPEVALVLPLWSSSVFSPVAVCFSASSALSSAPHATSDCFQYWWSGSEPRPPESSVASPLITDVQTKRCRLVYWPCSRICLCVRAQFLTCQSAGVSEGPYVRVGQLGEQWDEGAHQVAVKYDAVLTLSHQHRHEVAELRVEPAAIWSRLYQRILHAILQRREGREEKKL